MFPLMLTLFLLCLSVVSCKKTTGGQVPLGVNRANFRIKNSKLPLSGPKQSELGLTEKRKVLIDEVKFKIARKQKVLELNRLKRLTKQDDKKLDRIELSRNAPQIDGTNSDDLPVKRESKLLELFRARRARLRQ